MTWPQEKGLRERATILLLSLAMCLGCELPPYGRSRPDCYIDDPANYRPVRGNYSFSYEGPDGTTARWDEFRLYVTIETANKVGLYFCGFNGSIQWDGDIGISTSYDQGPPARVVTYGIHQEEVYAEAGFVETPDTRPYQRPFVTQHFPRIEMRMKRLDWESTQFKHVSLTPLEGIATELDPVEGRLLVQFSTPEHAEAGKFISFEADIEWKSAYKMYHPEPLTGEWTTHSEHRSLTLTLVENRTTRSTAVLSGFACFADRLEEGESLEGCVALSGVNYFQDPYLSLAWEMPLESTAGNSEIHHYSLQGQVDHRGQLKARVSRSYLGRAEHWGEMWFSR